jgi:alpha-1,2-mannosyltransferase
VCRPQYQQLAMPIVRTDCAQPWLARLRHVLILTLIAGALLVLLLQTLRQAYRPQGYDFTSYLLSAKALWEGGNPYKTGTTFEYIYPLFLAFVLIPLSMVPYWLANLLWFALSVSSLLFVCQALPKLAEFEMGATSDGRWLWPAAIVLAVLFSPIQNNLLNGQVNLIVLFCCTMFLRSCARERSAVAAAWLGAAIAIKIVPGILVVFLLVRGRFRIVAWTACFAAFFCLLPAVVAGKNIVGFYEHYWNWFFWPSALGRVPPNGMFFSLRGTLQYLLPGVGATAWLRTIAQVVSLSALVAIDLAGRKSPPPQRDVWAFSTYLLGCLLLSPTAEIHHLVFAVPAVCLIAAKMLFGRRWPTKTVVALAACFVLCFDVMARLYVTTPLFFVSLVVLLVLVFLAIADSWPDADSERLQVRA